MVTNQRAWRTKGRWCHTFPSKMAPSRWPCIPRNKETRWWQPLPGRQESTEQFWRQMKTCRLMWGSTPLPLLPPAIPWLCKCSCCALHHGCGVKGGKDQSVSASTGWPDHRNSEAFFLAAGRVCKFTLKQFLITKCSQSWLATVGNTKQSPSRQHSCLQRKLSWKGDSASTVSSLWLGHQWLRPGQGHSATVSVMPWLQIGSGRIFP